MITYREALESYEKTKHMTNNPIKLVLISYRIAIESLKEARAAYERNDFIQKTNYLQKAMDIIYCLDSALDMKKGGHIASNLRNIYRFIIKALVEADLKKDLLTFDKVIAMLSELESAWKVVAKNFPDSNDHLLEKPEASVTSNLSEISLARAWNA